MKIPDSLNGPNQTPEPTRSPVEQASRTGRSSNGHGSQGAAKGAKSSEHFAAPEIIELTNQLRELPDVRQKLVARVARQLQSGSYLTREAAERTAENLLGDPA
jgi:hypothetical protein